ncbi:MAG: polyphosphate kinase 2 family protein [Ardenticatenaceae bacterium]|nr:polyphosphate kinase 2 family protein [Ardenticatenaceae bacterium]
MTYLHRLQPGQDVNLAEMPTRGKSFYEGDKETAVTEFKAARDKLIELQNRFYAEGKRKLLIVLQAMDAGGKDGTIRNVLRGVNPQGVRVYSFKVPSKEELAHDFLWRIHQVAPPTGMIHVFNRSHYEDVLVVRVHDIVPETVWRPRYTQINQFEKLLHDTGTTILKFYLHISPEAQKERFQARLDDTSKHWKFSLEDLEKRKFWDDYMAAYEEMLEQCTTPWAPWHVIPADQKWYRNLAVTNIIVNTLQQLDPQYPTTTDDLSEVVIA